MSSDIANMALRSIIRQAHRTEPSRFDANYLLGAVDAMRTYFEPDAALVQEAQTAVDELRRKVAA